jgi:hypothetical protein
LFTMRLSYSARSAHRAFLTQGQEAFLEGHVARQDRAVTDTDGAQRNSRVRAHSCLTEDFGDSACGSTSIRSWKRRGRHIRRLGFLSRLAVSDLPPQHCCPRLAAAWIAEPPG